MNCSTCGAAIEPGHRFCPSCGTEHAAAQAAPLVPPLPITPPVSSSDWWEPGAASTAPPLPAPSLPAPTPPAPHDQPIAPTTLVTARATPVAIAPQGARPKGTRRRRRWLLIVSTLLVLGGAGVGGALWWQQHHDPNDPRTTPLPAVTELGATKQWLSGQGAVAVAFADATRPLTVSPPTTADECARWTSDNLNSFGKPSDLVAALATSPDDPTGQIVLNHFDIVTRWLAACVQQTPGPSSAELSASQTIVDRRLAEVEAG